MNGVVFTPRTIPTDFKTNKTDNRFAAMGSIFTGNPFNQNNENAAIDKKPKSFELFG